MLIIKIYLDSAKSYPALLSVQLYKNNI